MSERDSRTTWINSRPLVLIGSEKWSGDFYLGGCIVSSGEVGRKCHPPATVACSEKSLKLISRKTVHYTHSRKWLERKVVIYSRMVWQIKCPLRAALSYPHIPGALEIKPQVGGGREGGKGFELYRCSVRPNFPEMF